MRPGRDFRRLHAIAAHPPSPSLDVSAVRCLAAHDGPVCLHGLGDVGAETAALLAASPTRYFTGPIAPARDR